MTPEAADFKKYLENFAKVPILPKQNAEILKLMLDGTINATGGKKLLRFVIEENMKRYHEFLAMTEEELLALMDKYGIEYEKV